MSKKEFRSGFVGIVGRPNVGKSTLMNHLVGQKIAITSAKPQTTRSQIRTVYTCPEGQIVFLDTPGIHKAENKLGEYMDDVAFETLSQVDVILWLVEPSSFSGAGEKFIASKLKLAKKPVILVMNKIDTVDKKKIPEYMDLYRKLYPFEEIIPVSALRSVNIDSILEAVFAHLPEGPMYYDEETVTDQTMRTLAAEIIREKALRCLKEEVPHGIAVEILSMKERELTRKAASEPGREDRAPAAGQNPEAEAVPGTEDQVDDDEVGLEGDGAAGNKVVRLHQLTAVGVHHLRIVQMGQHAEEDRDAGAARDRGDGGGARESEGLCEGAQRLEGQRGNPQKSGIRSWKEELRKVFPRAG